MMNYPHRYYTDRDNRIRRDRVAAENRPGAGLVAQRERSRFEQDPAADSIDAVDAAYERQRIRYPDSQFRDFAIAAHVEGRPSFALGRNAAAELALGAIYRGESLVEHIVARARGPVGNPLHQPFPDRLTYHAGRIMPDLHPVNEAARRLKDEALCQIEEMAVPARPTGRRLRAAS